LVISPKPKKPAYIIALQQFLGGATAGKRMIESWPVIIANILTLLLSLSMLLMKFFFSRRSN